MISLYKLITKTNLKSPAIAFPLVTPIIFILLFSVGIGPDKNADELASIVAIFVVTVLSIQTMQSGLMGFGVNFMEIKNSVLLRRIGATKLNKFDVLGAVFLYGITMWLISFLWIFIATMGLNGIGLFYSNSTTGGQDVINRSLDFMTKIEWGKLFISLIMMIVLSYSLGLFFTSIVPNIYAYHAISMLYFFVVSFMGGMLIPGAQPEWMTYVGYIIPHSYVSELFIWSSGNVEIGGSGWSHWENETLWISKAKFAMNFICPLIISFLCIFSASKFLKYD